MPPATLPPNETERLEALKQYKVLDTMCEENFDRLTGLAARLTNCPTALVSLIDKERQWFKSRHGLNAVETHRDEAFCAHAILHPQIPLVVPDATQDERFSDNPLVTGALGLRFYAGVPLVNPQGHALGTLCVLDYAAHAISSETLEALATLAQAVMAMLELRRTLHQVRELSLTDMLTGLANRSAFMGALAQTIARAKRDARPFSVLYLDLDGFKRINDRLGHATGDRVLVQTAQELRASIRKEDLAARLGGDEFGVMLVGGDGSEARRVAERLREALWMAMRAHGYEVSASIGAVTFVDPPADQSAAIALADDCMYAAKNTGKNRVVCNEYIAETLLF